MTNVNAKKNDDNHDLICHTWQGQNINIPNTYFNPQILSQMMFQIAQKENYTSSQKQFEQFCQEAFFQKSEDYFLAVFLHIQKNCLTGFLNVRVQSEEVEIDYICVDRMHRRQHIAEKLFHFFTSVALKNQNKIFLEVGVDNISAISFYHKLGFQKISERKKYYKNGENALIMQKWIYL